VTVLARVAPPEEPLQVAATWDEARRVVAIDLNGDGTAELVRDHPRPVPCGAPLFRSPEVWDGTAFRRAAVRPALNCLWG